MQRFRSIALLCAACVGLAAAAMPGRAEQAYNANGMTFSRTGHNQWGAPGDIGLMHWQKTHDFSFSPKFGPVIDTPLETVGVAVVFAITGQVGIGIDVWGRNGEINARYPMDVVLTYPDPRTLRPGDAFTIGSSFARAGTGALSTTAPDFGFKLRGILTGQVDVDATIYWPGPSDSSANLFSSGPIDLSTDIFNTDLPGFRELVGSDEHFELLNGIIEGTYGFPNVTTSGGNGPGNTLVSTGSDDFLTVDLSITDAVLALLGSPIDLNGEGSTFDGALSWEFHVLDLYFQAGLSIAQKFTLDPRPVVSLQFSTGVTKTFFVGDPVSLTMPLVTGGSAVNNLTVTPTFTTEAQVRNQSDLEFTIGLFFEPLSGSLTVNILDWIDETVSASLGTIEIFNETFTTSLIDKTFTMKGFNTITKGPLTIEGFRYPTAVLSEVTPAMVKLNSGAINLVAKGTDFVDAYTNAAGTIPSSQILWDGVQQTTTFNSTTQLTAPIPASLIAVEGAHQVRVKNPAPGGGLSNPLPVIVDGTPPQITATPNPALLDKTGNPNVLVSVTVSGSITDALSGVDPATAKFSVDDEYDAVEPSGTITLNADETFSFVVRLSPTRKAKDTDGRVYSIKIECADKLGFVGTRTIQVVAPQG
jgi:hypothetical protein